MKSITFEEYNKLSEDDRDEYDFYLKYGIFENKDYICDIALEDRDFITVKEIMSSVDNENKLLETLYSLPEYNYSIIKDKPFYEVIITFKYLVEHLVQLIKMEGELLVSKVPGPDYSDKIEAVDFTVFPGYYSQLRLLAQNDITRFEAIKHMKYSDCFVELLYLQKEEDLQKLIDNENRRKMK